MFVAVQEWYQADTYNLYQSDTRGVRYSLVLEDVRSSRQAEESVVIDILEVGPEGRLGPLAWAAAGRASPPAPAPPTPSLVPPTPSLVLPTPALTPPTPTPAPPTLPP